MKKLTLLCMLAAVLLLWGCSQEELPAETQAPTTQATEPTTEPSTAPTEPPSATADYTDALTYIALPYTVEEAAPEGKTLATYRYPTPSLILPDPELSGAITLDLLNRIDGTRPAAEKLFSDATASPPEQYPYYYNVHYTPTRLDKNVLSISISESIFDGTAASATLCSSVTYDLSTGYTLSLSTMMKEDYSAEALIDLIIEGLSGYSEYEIYEEHPDLIRQMFSANTTAENWYLSGEGLCFYFAPYEIGPHASGTILSTIPYEKLFGLLRDDYYPLEQVRYVGSLVRTDDVSPNDLADQYGEFAELSVDDSGNMMLLSTKGSVADLRLTQGFDDGVSVTELTVFYAQGLGPDLAVMIEADAQALQSLTAHWLSGDDPQQAALATLE